MSSRLPFLVFLGTFLSLYGLLHVYFYWKTSRAIRLKRFHHGLVIGSLFFLLIMPVVTTLFARYEGEALAEATAYIGYYWMAGVFLFFSIHGAMDFVYGALALSARCGVPRIERLRPGRRASWVAASSLVLAILIYGSFEARAVRVRHVAISTAKLRTVSDRLRIVQVSDIHFGPINGLREARAIARKVRDLRPDVLVSTGDLIDRGMKNEEAVAAVLRDIEAPLGKFAVTGNHEIYTGIPIAARFMDRAGFRLLRNEFVTLRGGIALAGVDDPAVSRMGLDPDALEAEVLSRVPEEDVTILLKHQPRVLGGNPGRFDLQLSGHTHRGQIFPFGLVIALVFPYPHGLHALDGGRVLYVSAGTGTWGPPVRFLAPPEITVIDLQRPGAEGWKLEGGR